MATKGKHNWKYCSVGGVTRVNIASGDDIAHLGELDQKLWTVLSCPAQGLEIDNHTLALLDTDSDGKIRVDEIVAASQWLTKVLRDPALLLKGEDSIKLSDFNSESEEGRALLSSAKQILANLKQDKDSISIADTSDRIAIFAQTRFNGDGIITPATADNEALRAEIEAIMSTQGTVTDRSGDEGVDADRIEAFYAAIADYKEWHDSADGSTMAPYGDNTATAYEACQAMRDKIADYFMRCNLVAFDEQCTDALDVSVEKVSAIGSGMLTACTDEIASYPLARPTKEARLPLRGPINPAWQAAFAQLKSLVLDVDFPSADSISEAEWNGIIAKFEAYAAWCAAKKGTSVESLGYDTISEMATEGHKADLLALVEQDKALAAEADSINNVDKLMYLYRDFYRLLRNYVIFTDFYSPDVNQQAIFQAGQLYIDQRCCNLCIRVNDMGKQLASAGLSGMYLIYCHCVSKTTATEMDIVAALTDGDVYGLREGQNALFYDRAGNDYDAVVTKIIDNPISVRQAFWSPYRKLGNWITDKITKNAAEKESKQFEEMTAKADTASTNLTTKPEGGAATAEEKKAQMFDIAKFSGIFAAIGLALGAIGGALASLGGFVTTKWYNIILLIGAIVVIISGPSMLLAWLKLRKRNLGPILNANGWAINAHVLVNTRFGATLTSLAKYPKLKTNDPFADRTPAWKRWLRWILLILIIVFFFLFFTGKLERYGLSTHRAAAADTTAVVQEAAAEAPAE
ncbi:MAG: hypothetical protein IJV22_07200 [Bacteroidales bacterium]|nr:hypothetical protein [Bacteroidales bacterium]